jgi:hypothetical protein
LGDRVECYHCEKEIGDWLVPKDPWFEHAKQSPNCFHVRLVKGPEYIRCVQAKQSNTQDNNVEPANEGAEDDDNVEGTCLLIH